MVFTLVNIDETFVMSCRKPHFVLKLDFWILIYWKFDFLVFLFGSKWWVFSYLQCKLKVNRHINLNVYSENKCCG
jgi:hypothetical protein